MLLKGLDKFRNLKEISIEYNKKKTTVVFGYNASGKTSLLDSIFLNRSNHQLLKEENVSITYIPMKRISRQQETKPTLDFVLSQKANNIGDKVMDFTEKDLSKEQNYEISRVFCDEILGFSQEIENLINTLFEASETKLKNYDILSDGYKSTVNIICHILFESIVNNNQALDFQNYCRLINSVVLIDEIDAYIHQKIQYKILDFLEELFPMCTFIITTHSPVILRSLKKENLLYELWDGKLIRKNTVYLEELDKIVQEFFNINFSDKQSHILLEFFDEYFRNPSHLDNLTVDKKNELLYEVKKAKSNRKLYSDSQHQWIDFLWDILNVFSTENDNI